MPKLIYETEPGEMQEHNFESEATLGRLSSNDIAIPGTAASRNHARIFKENGQFFVEDLGSRNGTQVNGKTEKKQSLKDGDTIKIGTFELMFVEKKTDSLSGKSIGDFLLKEKLGGGRIGVAFTALHKGTADIVVIKLLTSRLGKDKDFSRTFKEEASLAAKLKHANAAKVISSGDQNGILFYASEHIDGETLFQNEKKLDTKRALEIAAEIAALLKYTVENKLEYIDIYPQNIYIDHNGHARVCDFAFPRTYAKNNEPGPLPYYDPPEKILGKKLDIRSNIYSLGALLYHMLSGEPPYSGKDGKEIGEKHTKSSVPHLKDANKNISDSVSDLVYRMMSKNPSDRGDSAGELVQELNKLAASESEVKPAEDKRPAREPRQRSSRGRQKEQDDEQAGSGTAPSPAIRQKSSSYTLKIAVVFVIFASLTGGAVWYILNNENNKPAEDSSGPKIDKAELEAPFPAIPPDSLNFNFETTENLGNWKNLDEKAGSWTLGKGNFTGSAPFNKTAIVSLYRYPCNPNNTTITGEMFIPAENTAIAVEIGNSEISAGFTMTDKVLATHRFRAGEKPAADNLPMKKIAWSCSHDAWYTFKLSFKNGEISLSIDDTPYDDLKLESGLTTPLPLLLKVTGGDVVFDNIKIDFKN